MEPANSRREMPQNPLAPTLVSILVVVFNAHRELQELLESIFELKSTDVELIVVDGGSGDGTVEYLRSQQEKIDSWLSEPDQGIYDAMNKVAARATGTFLLHLNAGDRLLGIPRAELERARDAGVELLSFPVELGGGRTFHPSYGRGLRFNNTLHHQGTFYRRSACLPYDTRFKVFADFDLNQRLARSGARAKIGKQVVAFHAVDGVSAQKTAAGKAEFLEVVRKNYGAWAVGIARIMGKWRGLKARLGFG